MSKIIKNKELSKETKYFYFIPRHDIINNEIYFFDFFTERIVSKPKKIIKKKKKQIEFNQCTTVKNNLLIVGKVLKKVKDQIRGKRSKTNASKKVNKDEDKLKNFVSSKDNKFIFLINEKDKEFCDENNFPVINRRKSEKKNKKINKIKTEKILLDKFSLNWKKMKIISGFNENNYVSPRFYEYFSRPLYSRFLKGQNLQLYSFNSTLPLSNVMSIKPYINIYIYYDIDNFLDFKPNNERNQEFNMLNNIKNEFQIFSDTPIKISLFYIVDSKNDSDEELNISDINIFEFKKKYFLIFIYLKLIIYHN